MNKKSIIRILSLFLIIMIVMSSALVSVFAMTINGKELLVSDKSNKDEKNLKNFKEETVYVVADSKGNPEEIIVSDWIQNNTLQKEITDCSNLKNIKNIQSDETYTLNKDNMQVWNANGEDIRYQGDSDNFDLPVEVALSYTLDGSPIAPDELKGKSGTVGIKFDYKNNQKEIVEIDGKKEKIYVPYVMITGAIFDNENFSNFKVSNGKIIDTGSKTIVAGIAIPGLQENLQLDENKIELPSSVEITADVKDFEMTSTITLASNSFISDINLDSTKPMDELESQLGDLQSGITSLIDGSSKLYDGIAKLYESTGELSSGVSKLTSGAEKLKDGASSISAGSIQIDAGIGDLASGLSVITSNNSTLQGGSKKVFNSLLSQATSAIKAAGLDCPELTMDNYTKVLNAVINNLSDENVRAKATETAKAKVTDTVEAQRDTITEAVTSAVKESVSQQVESEYGSAILSGVQDAVVQNAGFADYNEYLAAVSAGLVPEESQSAINDAITSNYSSTLNTYIDETMQSETVQNTISEKTQEKINELINENMNSEEVQGQINNAVQLAQQGRASVEALLSQLNEYNTFNDGISEYTNGVSSASNGASTIKGYTSQLANGSSSLSSGSIELYKGALTLNENMPKLTDGVSQLKSGSMQLSDGLKEFNDKGIKKIINLYSSDIKPSLTRLRATVDVSKEYKTFTDIPDDMDGSVKFIYKTQSIE